MCIIAVAYRASARYPLIVAANRDELHARPSLPANWWSDRPGVLSGRDLVAGGTWLGITTGGRFAAVTNIAGAPAAPATDSRGILVGNFLATELPGARYVSAIAGERFGPFNLLLLDSTGLRHVSNAGPASTLGPGVHVFSNNTAGVAWPKVDRLAGDVLARIAAAEPAAALTERLFDLLTGPAARGEFASAPASTFIVGDTFGTRSSSVIVIDAEGAGRFVERRFGPGGSADGESRFEFSSAMAAS